MKTCQGVVDKDAGNELMQTRMGMGKRIRTFPPEVAHVRHGCVPLSFATVAKPSCIVFFNESSKAGVNCDALAI